MGHSIQTYEVRVEVKQKGSRHFSAHVGMYIEKKLTKMFHIDARTPEQASQRAGKHGRPLSVRKVDTDRLAGAGLLVAESHGANNPYSDAIAMDELIWKRKSKRAERIESREKHKGGS